MAPFTATIPTPQFRVSADSCSRSLQQDSLGNLYCVLQGEYGAGGSPGNGALVIWKSTDNGHTWAKLVNDTDKFSDGAMDVCIIADVLHIVIDDASIAPNSRLGMYRYNTATNLFLADDFGGPADSANCHFACIAALSNGSVSICYKSNDFNGGAFTQAKITNWLAGVWAASVPIANENTADIKPQWAIKEKTSERIHYFFADDAANLGTGFPTVWHISLNADGATLNTLQDIATGGPFDQHPLASSGSNASGDIGNPSIKGADVQLVLPYVLGPASMGLDNQESLRVVRATPAANPVWTDEEAVAAAAIADGNIEPFLGDGYFDCASVVTPDGTITLIFTFTDDDPASADVQGWLYTTASTLLVGGWAAPSLLFTGPQPCACACPYAAALANGTYGVVIGTLDPVTFPAYDALGLTFIGFEPVGPPPTIECDDPPVGKIGVAYSHFFPAAAGTPPYTFTITAGALPPGLALDAATGEVSGTPTAAGTFGFTVTVTDSTDQTAEVECSILIKTCLL